MHTFIFIVGCICIGVVALALLVLGARKLFLSMVRPGDMP